MSRMVILRVRLYGILFRIGRLIKRILGVTGTIYVQDRVATYEEFWRQGAKKLGMQFVVLDRANWEVWDGDRKITRINNYIAQLDDPVTLNIAGDKLLTFQLLATRDITIPRYAMFDRLTPERVAAFTASNSGPYVVKPARGTSSGLGVSTMLKTSGDCVRACAIALSYCDDAMIEEHVSGECYRLLYLGNRFLRAARRGGFRVVGNGRSTIAELISGEKTDTDARWQRDSARDADVNLTLRAQGLVLASVPDGGRSILVRSSAGVESRRAEVRTEYDEDVTHLICTDIASECARATQLVGSEFCGVDVITVDPSKSLAVTGGIIDEINTTPGLHHHYGLRKGEGAAVTPAVDQDTLNQDVAALVLRHLSAR